jgi:hypothetical protein
MPHAPVISLIVPVWKQELLTFSVYCFFGELSIKIGP